MRNERAARSHPSTQPLRTVAVAIVLFATLAAGTARAQLPIPPSSQFDITGFIQEATLGAGLSGLNVGAGAAAHQGGILKVNGQTIIVPSETIVILPASALTWQELFAQAPAPWGIPGTTTPGGGVAFNTAVSAAAAAPTTGMASADCAVAPVATGCPAAPLTTYEARVVGNRVLGGSGGADVYVAGLVYVSQHALNSGQGFINFIDYANAELRVGGVLNSATTGTRVRINDPVVGTTGRYSKGLSPDVRFTVDQDNPTIAAGTGFPMCLPRVDPATGSDALCPQAQRPAAVAPATGFAATIQMNNPVTLPGVPPDATIQVPFEVGDYVTFAGTLVKDCPATGCVAGDGPTVGPWPAAGTAATYVSAHTISNNVAIYTFPGTNPAYVSTEVTLIGTGGLTVVGAGEAAIRTRFEGMTTDPSRNIHLYGIDLDPATGATSDRDWGTIGVDPGPPTGAVKGRWRFRPPCTATVATDKACTPPPAGTFLPPTREVRAVIEGLQSQNPANPTAVKAANGIFYGQYHAPILDYIFPENIPGSPIVENNFNTIDFLARGGYSSALGTLVKVLDPWPSNVVPTPACTPPAAVAGGPYSVAFNGTVTLAGTASGTGPLTLGWTVTSGSLTNAATATPTFSAVGATSPVTATLTVTSTCTGVPVSASSNATITINAATAPTVAHVNPVTTFSGSAPPAAGTSFVVSATDPNVPALLPLTFQVTQSPAGTLLNLTLGAVTCTAATATCTATVTFTAPTLPVGQVTPTVANLTITARNTAGVVSAPEFTSVTVNPLPDVVAIPAGGAEYRTGKQRLVINATSSVVSPNVVLTLQPYACETPTPAGTPPCPSGTFDPATLGATFTNNGGGLYLITLVGAPAPRCNGAAPYATPCTATPLVVKSNLGGVSQPHALDRIRP